MKNVEALSGVSRRASLGLARIVVAFAGVFYVATAIALLFTPFWFFQTVGNFGPFNQHYEGDIGAFQLALGLGLLVAAYRPSQHSLLIWVGAVGSLFHAGNHLYTDLVEQPSVAHLFNTTIPLFLFAALLLWAAVSSTIEQRRQIH